MRGSHTRLSELTIERQVQQKNVHAWLTEEAELAAFDLRVDDLRESFSLDAARLGDARHLPVRAFGRDVRIEARGRRADELSRDRATRVRVLLLQTSDVCL